MLSTYSLVIWRSFADLWNRLPRNYQDVSWSLRSHVTKRHALKSKQQIGTNWFGWFPIIITNTRADSLPMFPTRSCVVNRLPWQKIFLDLVVFIDDIRWDGLVEDFTEDRASCFVLLRGLFRGRYFVVARHRRRAEILLRCHDLKC